MNLLSSFRDDREDDEDDAAEVDGIHKLIDDKVGTWIGEYQRGCDWEVYTTALSDIFVGAKFVALSEVLYQKLGILLFAIEIMDLKKDGVKRLLLNPGLLCSQSQFFI